MVRHRIKALKAKQNFLSSEKLVIKTLKAVLLIQRVWKHHLREELFNQAVYIKMTVYKISPGYVAITY